MSSGGKGAGATRARTFFQAGKSLFKEALAPLADDFSPGIQASSDLIVRPTLGSVKDHFGAEHLKIWQRIFRGSALQFLSFSCCELDFERTVSRHEAKTARISECRKA
jgi:hypothetical protein